MTASDDTHVGKKKTDDSEEVEASNGENRALGDELPSTGGVEGGVGTPSAMIETTSPPEEVTAVVGVFDDVIALSIRSEFIAGKLFFQKTDAEQLRADIDRALVEIDEP